MSLVKILIIDDMQSIRDALRAYLCPPASAMDMLNSLLKQGSFQAKEFLINEAEQGEEGVAMARSAHSVGKPYDVIFVDMLMPPGIGGLEVIKRIRTFDKTAKIIVCTAISNEAPEEMREANGGVMPLLLSKPLTENQNLPQLVESLLVA